jgi:hypothetical protein
MVTLVGAARTLPEGPRAAKELNSIAAMSTMLEIVLLAFMAQLLY